MTFYNKVMGSIGGLVIGLMMLLVVIEVLSRFLTGRSIEGTIEIVSIFLALAIFLGFSPCEEADNHVRVQLVVRLLPSEVAFVIDIVVYILAIGIVMITAWQTGLEALSSWKVREVLPGFEVQVPIYPAKIVCFIGYLAFCFQLVVNFAVRVKHSKGKS